jgi:hypothetical protein
MELRHSAQIKAKAEKANEITILATPCLELGHDEQLYDYEPTIMSKPTKMNHLTKKQRNNRRQNQKDLLKQKQKTVGLKPFQCHLRRHKNLYTCHFPTCRHQLVYYLG